MDKKLALRRQNWLRVWAHDANDRYRFKKDKLLLRWITREQCWHWIARTPKYIKTMKICHIYIQNVSWQSFFDMKYIILDFTLFKIKSIMEWVNIFAWPLQFQAVFVIHFQSKKNKFLHWYLCIVHFIIFLRTLNNFRRYQFSCSVSWTSGCP